jgi:hypothetical protein
VSAPQDSQLYPLGGDLALAGKLTAGHTARVVVYTFDNHPYTDGFNRALREQLAAIGLRTTIRRMTNTTSETGAWPGKQRRPISSGADSMRTRAIPSHICSSCFFQRPIAPRSSESPR